MRASAAPRLRPARLKEPPRLNGVPDTLERFDAFYRFLRFRSRTHLNFSFCRIGFSLPTEAPPSGGVWGGVKTTYAACGRE